MPFDSPELLSDAGYDSGDTLWTVHANTDNDGTTTSNSYRFYDVEDTTTNFQWDTTYGQGDQGRAVMWARVDTDTDQVDIRLRNVIDNETILEQTGITGGANQDVVLGPTDYTPTTTSSQIRVGVQFRNGDNTTSVTADTATYAFGTQL